MAAMNAPMLQPPTRSISMPAAANSSSTPMCANARAPPPEKTTPTERPAIRRAARRRRCARRRDARCAALAAQARRATAWRRPRCSTARAGRRRAGRDGRRCRPVARVADQDENPVGLPQREGRPLLSVTPGEDDVIVIALEPLEQLRALDGIGPLLRAEQRGRARGLQLAHDAGDDVGDRQAVLERDDARPWFPGWGRARPATGSPAAGRPSRAATRARTRAARPAAPRSRPARTSSSRRRAGPGPTPTAPTRPAAPAHRRPLQGRARAARRRR